MAWALCSSQLIIVREDAVKVPYRFSTRGLLGLSRPLMQSDRRGGRRNGLRVSGNMGPNYRRFGAAPRNP
jgi:hypothetical protein